VKGISLFVVPKFMVNADGSLGARNDVHCVSIEHKMGIKASPTAVLQFGDHGGAVGYLVGQENRGLEYMFIMMNAARYGVGVQGIAMAERAYQKAVQLRPDRVQSRPVDGSMNASAAHHPPPGRAPHADDHARLTEGCRAMASTWPPPPTTPRTTTPTPRCASRTQAFYEFMVPLVKGYSTEMSLEVTSLGVQVHGGMGFIEETGAAQYYRDAKILTIYEGTTAIQANDLVGRKTARDGGQSAKAIAAQIERPRRTAGAAAARRSQGRGQAAARRAPGLPGRGGLRRRQRQGQPQRRVRGQRALPDAGRQPGGGLAAGACACWWPNSSPKGRTRLHEGQDHHGALLRRPHPGRVPGLRDSIVDGADSVTPWRWKPSKPVRKII
jgi:hypothetical protein